MVFTGLAVVCLRGFWSRIAIFLGLVVGSHALRVFAPAHWRTREPLLDEGTSSYDAKVG